MYEVIQFFVHSIEICREWTIFLKIHIILKFVKHKHGSQLINILSSIRTEHWSEYSMQDSLNWFMNKCRYPMNILSLFCLIWTKTETKPNMNECYCTHIAYIFINIVYHLPILQPFISVCDHTLRNIVIYISCM